ncbi:MAG: hypothetical protein GY945_05320, partial [Rhodobacteraceae bacterium]|nr:hypothetical protein [Paracoccaceae bacterium]
MRVAKTPFFFAALIGVSSPVLADDSCAPMIFDTNDCLVGNWVGTNTIAERMQAMLGTLAPAGVSRQVFPDDFARVMGMVIYPDGFYATLPFHSSLTMHDLEDGELTITDMDLAVTSNFGWIWTAGTALRFCALEGSSAMLSMDVSSPGGNASASFDPSAAPNNYMPDITYSCAGDTFSMTIALP